ncbi:hypothetical protein LT85_1944 [Collimonas arenae]|uniref:Uncharacterized protein n=1 Tax=Collimonas arenae TaxID=279058 RepID=A0A0A1FE18_9BURK|nr:hypothetical protein LT85_1944 [Collimonas arenae]
MFQGQKIFSQEMKNSWKRHFRDSKAVASCEAKYVEEMLLEVVAINDDERGEGQ